MREGEEHICRDGYEWWCGACEWVQAQLTKVSTNDFPCLTQKRAILIQWTINGKGDRSFSHPTTSRRVMILGGVTEKYPTYPRTRCCSRVGHSLARWRHLSAPAGCRYPAARCRNLDRHQASPWHQKPTAGQETLTGGLGSSYLVNKLCISSHSNEPFVTQPSHLVFTNSFSKEGINPADFAKLKYSGFQWFEIKFQWFET